MSDYAACLSIHNYERKANTVTKNAVIKATPDNPLIDEKKKLHIHFGAGKLGIGLVLPIFKTADDQHLTILVVQKIRNEWEQIKDLGTVSLCNTQGFSLPFTLLTDNDNHDSVKEKWKKEDILLLTEKSYNQMMDLITEADSLSISFGQAGPQNEVASLLLSLSEVDRDRVPFFFAFENDPVTTITNLKNLPSIHYVPLKADRICSSRKFDIKNRKVDVTCEEYCEVICDGTQLTTEDQEIFYGLFGNHSKSSIRLALSDVEYFFYSNRKKYLLNELHFVLVVNGYSFLLSKGIYNWEKQYVPIIQFILEHNPVYRTSMDVYAKTQIIRLMIETEERYGKDALQFLFPYEQDYIIYDKLFKYYDNNVRVRLSKSGEDEIRRIFNLNDPDKVVKKFQDYVEQLKYFVDQNREKFIKMDILNKPPIHEIEENLSDLNCKVKKILERHLSCMTKQLDEFKDNTEKEIARHHQAIETLSSIL